MKWLLIVCIASGCVIGRRALVLPPDDGIPTLMVSSGAMPEPIRHVARHAWFVMRRDGDHDGTRWECCDRGPDHGPPFAMFGGGNVILHGVFRGARREDDGVHRGEDAGVRVPRRLSIWPGPNSNTYVEAMLRRCGVHVDLPATCVGRDYRGAFGASTTSGGTGSDRSRSPASRSGSPRASRSISSASRSASISWPPAIILPFEGGRLGFEDW